MQLIIAVIIAFIVSAGVAAPHDGPSEINRAVLLIGSALVPEAESEAERVRAVVTPPKVQKLVRLLAPLDHPPEKFAAGYILGWELKLYSDGELVKTMIFSGDFEIGNSGHGDCFTSQELREMLNRLVDEARE